MLEQLQYNLLFRWFAGLGIDVEAAVVPKDVVLEPLLDERARRLWAAAESRAIGFGGDALVSAATGLARQTIRRGR